MAVTIRSLNVHSFKNCSDYVESTLNDNCPEMLLLQESWHLSNNIACLRVSKDYMFKETSGVAESSRILAGRPFGGLVNYYMRTFADKIKKIPCDNKRICAIEYTNENKLPFLIVNVYMPCDNQTMTLNPVYLNVIHDVESILNDHIGDVCLGGDWNTDLSRNSAQTQCFNEFIERSRFKLCWEHNLADKQNTYYSEMSDATSCVDHFLLSENLFNGINCCYVDDNPLNPSDHREVVINFDYDMNSNIAQAEVASSRGPPGVAWHRVEQDHIVEYQSIMDEMLNFVDVNNNALHCDDPLCSNEGHRSFINSLCSDMIDICLDSGDYCFPKAKSPKCLPRWNELVKPFRSDSLFWDSVWKSAGKPAVGVLSMLRRRTRAKYHKAVRSLKKNHSSNRNTKIAEAFDGNNSRDLWAELKKLDNSRKATPCSINGATDNNEIAGIFSDKYKTLYSSVPTDPDEINQLKNEMNHDLSNAGFESVQISVDDVSNSIRNLNSRKRDGTLGTFSDHFIHCSHRMRVVLSLLINCMLVHGFSPDDLLEAVIVSIPKDVKGDLCSDSNYRGIALCSALCKIIDIIILDKYLDRLITSDLQFAFKKEHSTNMCTSILKEVCNYYKSKGSEVFITLLDATKAFDRVHYGKLFKLLEKRNIPALVRRLLLDMYTRQRMKTTWNGALSDSFGTTNGVKQGGILSPILFCLYIDELLIRINESGLGCHIGHLSYAGLGYADDVTTLAPSMNASQGLMKICEDFGVEYNVIWNCGKTYCLRIGSNGLIPVRQIVLNGNVLKFKKKVRHLGNIVKHDLCDYDDIMFKKGVFISQVNKLNNKFCDVTSSLRGKLFQTYCCSWYGCQTWEYDTDMSEFMQTEWNKAVRKILRLPYETHRNLLPLVVNSKSFVDQHLSRVKKFANSFITSQNEKIRFIGEMAMLYSYGPLGRNFVKIETLNNDTCNLNADVKLTCTAKAISDLLDVRDGSRFLPGLDRNDVEFFIEDLCCD